MRVLSSLASGDAALTLPVFLPVNNCVSLSIGLRLLYSGSLCETDLTSLSSGLVGFAELSVKAALINLSMGLDEAAGGTSTSFDNVSESLHRFWSGIISS